MLLSFTNAIKQFPGALAFILLCSLTIEPASSATVSLQRAEWSLFLKTEGAPWTKKFEVTLNQTGMLSVAEDDPAKMPAMTTAKVALNLSAKDAQEIYEQALKVFREFQFPKETQERTDGTNLTLRLTVHNRTLSMQVFHVGTPEEEVPEVGKLLALLNKHLTKAHQIY